MIRIKCSRYRASAERGGFEPPKPVSQFNGLANRRYRPLSHLSSAGVSGSADSPSSNPIGTYQTITALVNEASRDPPPCFGKPTNPSSLQGLA